MNRIPDGFGGEGPRYSLGAAVAHAIAEAAEAGVEVTRESFALALAKHSDIPDDRINACLDEGDGALVKIVNTTMETIPVLASLVGEDPADISFEFLETFCSQMFWIDDDKGDLHVGVAIVDGDDNVVTSSGITLAGALLPEEND